MKSPSSRMINAYAILLPFIAMLGALGLFLRVSANSASVGNLNVAYLSGEANLRTCPSTKCSSSAVYSEGQQVVVIRTIKGQNTQGTDKWVVVRFGNSERYINSAFVSVTPTDYQNLFW